MCHPSREKEISELTRDRVAELSQRHANPAPRGPVVVAACVAGEQHDLGSRMVVGLLRERGWRVHFLGADVSARFLTESVGLRNPDVVVLSATTAERLPAIEDVVRALQGLHRADPLPIVVGGPVAADHRSALESVGVIPVETGDRDAALRSLLGFSAGTQEDSTATPD